MSFTVLHNIHHKVSHSSCIGKFVTIMLRIRVRGHFVMSITENHGSDYVTVLTNPLTLSLPLVLVLGEIHC